MSIERVVSDVRRMKEEFGMTVLLLEDDHFFNDKDRAKQILRELAALDIRVEFPNGVAVYAIDDEVADLFSKAGVSAVALAVEFRIGSRPQQHHSQAAEETPDPACGRSVAQIQCALARVHRHRSAWRAGRASRGNAPDAPHLRLRLGARRSGDADLRQQALRIFAWTRAISTTRSRRTSSPPNR